MLLRRDRVLGRAGGEIDAAHRQLVTPRGPRVLAHRPGDGDGAFLRRVLARLPRGLVHVLPGDDSLHDSGAVPDQQEVELPAVPLVIEPAAHRDGSPGELPQILDVDVGRHSNSCFRWGVRLPMTRKQWKTPKPCTKSRQYTGRSPGCQTGAVGG